MTNVLDYLNETVGRYPDKAAFIDSDRAYSFSELSHVIDAVGSALIERGLYREPVLVFMEKSVDEIAAFFGTIAAGCYYVPIDAEMPALRIEHIIENCAPRACIVDESTRETAESFKFNGDIISFAELAATAPDKEGLARVRAKAIDTDPIYIVFTSGSTGIPKGVAACHRSVIDYIEQLSDVLGVSDDTVFGNQAPLYFDACLKELFPTLKHGATTHLIPRELFSSPIKLVEYMNEKRINTICWVVSALTMISAFKTFDTIKPESLRTVAFGSEVFTAKQYGLWKAACPDCRFINLYGPTEATGMSCYYEVDRDFLEDEIIPIGKTFKNTDAFLIKEDGTPAADGEEGEIVLRGTCVTLGYYNDPERTAAAFVQNPLQNAYPELVYRTGDIARYDDEGNLVFVSRRDNQIKHMGHRIELGEIEAAVGRVDGVVLSGCVYDDEKNKIVLFYTGTVEKAEVANGLKALLPRFMIPNRIYKLDVMPRTPNGKIDRKALKERY